MTSSTCPRCRKNNFKLAPYGDTCCRDCGWNKEMQSMLDALNTHALDVFNLQKRDPTTVKLIVGPEKEVLVHSKALPGYHSKVLDATFYGGFQESKKAEIELPEDDPKEMMLFVLWTQTGVVQLDTVYGVDYDDPAGEADYSYATDDDQPTDEPGVYTGTTLARLWVLGNKYLAPKFCNAITRLLIDMLRKFVLFTATARYIFENTLATSKLRTLILDRIQKQGPFLEDDKQGHHKAWLDCVEEGGELVREVSARGGFHKHDNSCNPFHTANRYEYMEDETTQPKANCWRQGEV